MQMCLNTDTHLSQGHLSNSCSEMERVSEGEGCHHRFPESRVWHIPPPALLKTSPRPPISEHIRKGLGFSLRTILRATARGFLSCLPVGSKGCSVEVLSGGTQWALPNEWHWDKGPSVQSNQDLSRYLKADTESGPPHPGGFESLLFHYGWQFLHLSSGMCSSLD